MKFLPALLLFCLLLSGCGDQSPAAPETQVPATEFTALYDPGSPMEAAHPGVIRTYPLPMADVTGIRAVGNDLLVFSGDGQTTLTLLRGEDLYPRASIQLDFRLDPGDPSLRQTGEGLSFFDSARQKTVALNENWEEAFTIAAPNDLVGSPILSRDGRTLFYCTAHGIRAWDLESGLRRLLKAVSAPDQRLTGLHLGDRVLQYTTGRRTVLISAQDGRLLWEGPGDLSLHTAAGHYFASLPAGMNQLLLFGTDPKDPWQLTPADPGSGACTFLEYKNSAVTAAQGPETVLSCYDLASGALRSQLSLPHPAQVEDTMDGSVYVLTFDDHYGSQVLYRWDIDALPAEDRGVYTFPYFTADAPDREGLARCQAYADDIGRRYGINVLIWEEAAGAQPWDYDFEPEHLVPFIQRELELLDGSLSHFPKSVLEDTMAHFSSLTICLVRSITGTPESGSVEDANGLHFLSGTDVYLALAVSPSSDHPLYHELFHVMETHLLGGSTAFDQWNNINPPDFSYSYSYAQAPRAGDAWLKGEGRAFIDRYSMTFPKEDRARIMEYAMTPGNEALFQNKLLQAKLEVLCRSIRQAYGLKKSPETFLWEQYLNTPMACEK